MFREKYSTFFAFFGKFSLELFVAQYHIWLSDDTQSKCFQNLNKFEYCFFMLQFNTDSNYFQSNFNFNPYIESANYFLVDIYLKVHQIDYHLKIV